MALALAQAHAQHPRNVSLSFAETHPLRRFTGKLFSNPFYLRSLLNSTTTTHPATQAEMAAKVQPHAQAQIFWHAKYLSLYLGARTVLMKVVEEDQAKIEKWDKKLDTLKGRRATLRHGVEELANTLRALNSTIPLYPSAQPHVPLPLAMPLPAPPPPHSPLAPPPATLSTEELNTLQATIALTTARLVNKGTNYAHVNELVLRLERKSTKVEKRNEKFVARCVEVDDTCRSLTDERKVLEGILKGKKDVVSADLPVVGGEEKGQEGEEHGGEKGLGEKEGEERAKEVIAWFGEHYSNVFGKDGGLKDAQEGTGKVMAFAEQVLEKIMRNIGAEQADVEAEEPKEEVKVNAEAGVE